MKIKRKIYAKREFEEVRLKNGMSLRNLAANAGLTPSVICKLENGKAITPSTAKKICDALGFEFDTLFELKEGENK